MRALALALLLTAVPAFAEDAKNGWHFEVTPYIWGAAATDTVGIQGLPELKVEASFSDIFSKFDLGFLGRIEGRKGRFGFSSHLVYLNPRPSPAGLARYYPASYYAFHAPVTLPSVASGSGLWQRAYLADQVRAIILQRLAAAHG